MLGEFKVKIQNSRNKYTFTLKRNITVLKGNSGRGKTTLFDMISEYNRFGKESGVSISCDKELVAVSGNGWEEAILNNPGKIIVIDEDSHFVKSKDFARVVRNSDNYYLLITRNYLAALPISVDEIYELKGEKNKQFKKVYSNIDKMYNNPNEKLLPFKPQVIITEDSGAGYQFFKEITNGTGIECLSSNGKSRMLKELLAQQNKKVLLIADGAAFGPEMEDVVAQQNLQHNRIGIYLPESFEWVILCSGVVALKDDEKLNFPEQYADSTRYMSWEQYFTELLVEATNDTEYMKYAKERLADYYFQEKIAQKIKDEIKGVDFWD